MTVDELKIQLESRRDLCFLQDELRKYLETNSFTTTTEQRERFLDDVFAIVGQNVQIDGVDTDKLPADEGGEEVDAQLESRLESLQAGTDQLLVEIAELRRRCPAEIREKFVLGLEDLERAMPGVREVLAPLDVSLDMRPEVVDSLLGELARLRQLNESIPQLAAKLQRARTVLTDSAGFDQPVAENIGDILNRQRRIARQHDLAARLLAQQ